MSEPIPIDKVAAVDFYKLSGLEILEDEYETLEDLDITNSSLLKSQHIFQSVLDQSDDSNTAKGFDAYKQYKQSEQLKKITDHAKDISKKHLELNAFVSEPDKNKPGSTTLVPMVFVLQYEIENIISYNANNDSRTATNVSICLTRPIVNIIDKMPEDIKSLFNSTNDKQVLDDKAMSENPNITYNEATKFLLGFKQKVVSKSPKDIFTTPENYYILCLFSIAIADKHIKCVLVKRKPADSKPRVESPPDKVNVVKSSKESKGKNKPKQIVAQIPYIPYRVSFEGIIRSTKDLLYNTPVVDVQSNKNKKNKTKYIDSKKVGAAFFNKYYNNANSSSIF